ncbi:MAG: Crp/Fnr family transcriptional regulator [Pseudomonadota bacterium]
MTLNVPIAIDAIAAPLTCASCSARSKSICRVLSADDLHQLNAIARHRRFEAGQTVVTEGDTAVLGVVVEGMLIERRTLSDGRDQIISLRFPADLVGGSAPAEMADANLEAATPTVLCSFDKAGFEQALNSLPHLQSALVDQMRRELTQARDWMLLLGQKNAREKVATFLLRLADRSRNRHCGTASDLVDGDLFEIPLGRAQIAAFLGLTIETVSRKFTEFQKQRMIELNGTRSVRVNDVAALRAAAG